MDNRWSRYPICYVAIDLPSSMIDYNIEPDKSSLLFLSLESVLELLKSILQSLYGDIHNNDQNNSTKYVGKTKETNFENYKCDMISDIDNETIERAEISPEKNKIDDSNEGLLNNNKSKSNHLQLNERNNNKNNISDEAASDAIIINEENYQNPSSRKDCLIQSSENNNNIPKCKEKSSDATIEDLVTVWLNDDDDFDEISKEIELEFPSENADDNEILQLSNNKDNSNCKNITNKDDNACNKTMENIEQAEKNERINWSLGNIRNEQGNFIEVIS
ncbi:probable serine/threonine-protein kinase DDB_G0283337 isoform X1 [Centruroides sculpturatus]|uniref:probable serine/threonine-protein kinase DDB_G0283337 isoform X1 n=1 Tax=Centruroides sculpturatus TaxID=218467 RepID=UPI000C6EB861|nr:probable serine/threonine-protein kinase DDB_G0283337 isoform X1 [Centruroides sculpturatus]